MIVCSEKLFEYEDVNIRISISAYFDDDGKVIVEGCDIGKTVKEAWGDSDYEYSSTIPVEEVQKLYPLFDVRLNDQRKLLKKIAERFNGNKCFSVFNEFLRAHNIKYEGFSWT